MEGLTQTNFSGGIGYIVGEEECALGYWSRVLEITTSELSQQQIKRLINTLQDEIKKKAKTEP